MWIMISNSLDIIFIHRDIHGRWCNKMEHLRHFVSTSMRQQHFVEEKNHVCSKIALHMYHER